jgi:superfamily II DNA or RNA helicase
MVVSYKLNISYYFKGVIMDKEFLLRELAELRKENDYLKNLLASMMHQHEQPTKVQSNDQILTNRSLPQEKINLFKRLFNVRTDAYAIRWESKDGKKGYTPACELEWQKPVCKKPQIKCSQCQDRKLSPLTDQVFYDHLSGKKTIGIYPMHHDETCSFLAFDFDKQNWQDDVLAFTRVCKSLGVPINIERSQSGNGAHSWLFFDENISAVLARKLGMALLSKTLENRHEIGLDSFDRMFPNQDTLPKGGFGNLIALPLQLYTKRRGNSVFLDETFTPFQDQWMYLSSIQKLTKKELHLILNDLDQQITGKDLEFNYTFPKKMTIHIKNGLYLNKEEITSSLFSKIITLASFKNPEFFKAQAKRMSTYGIPRIISCYDEDSQHIILPRGCLEELIKLLNEYSIEIECIDETYDGENVQFSFSGQLTSQQEEAVTALHHYSNGVLSATTGFGKTVTAAALIAKRNTNTLIIVDRKQLLWQWVEKLATFLNLAPKEIGQIGGGKKKITGKIDVATIQSLNSNGEFKSFITQYGQIIVDECHHIAAFSFEKVLKQIRAKYVHGLTATPIRKDNMHPIIFQQCGPIRYKVDAKTQAKVRPFTHKVIQRNTNFSSPSSNIQELYHALLNDERRNQQLFDDVLNELEADRSPIILTERVEHLNKLKDLFKGFAKNIVILSGSMTKKEQKLEMERLVNIPDNTERLIIATGKYIGEGFDDARLDTLYLAMPIAWKGSLQQYVGRLHRLNANKKEVRVYDYVDHKVPILKNMFEKRLTGYKLMGYKMENKEQAGTEQMRLF